MASSLATSSASVLRRTAKSAGMADTTNPGGRSLPEEIRHTEADEEQGHDADDQHGKGHRDPVPRASARQFSAPPYNRSDAVTRPHRVLNVFYGSQGQLGCCRHAHFVCLSG